MGAWIEITIDLTATDNSGKSLLSWERGLKYQIGRLYHRKEVVAPLVGAWIEIILAPQNHKIKSVAPLVGAWIEIISSYL